MSMTKRLCRFHEGHHDAFACTTQQIAFPVARDRTVVDVGRPVADVDHGGDLALAVGERIAPGPARGCVAAGDSA